MAGPIKLYLDEDTISRALIRALRARGVDLLTAQEAEQIGVPNKYLNLNLLDELTEIG